jgi:hypothetical protein
MFGERDITHDRFQASSVHLSRRIGNLPHDVFVHSRHRMIRSDHAFLK